MRTRSKILLSAIISSTFILAILYKTGIYFETNDDRIIAEILSGTFMGAGDAHVVYVNYLLALPLALLYSLTTNVPWYGGMLVLFQFICFFMISWSTIDRCTTKKYTVFMTVILSLFFLLNIYVLAMIQYTSTAAMLALAGYACLILQKGKRKAFVLFGIMELLAYLLRSQAMLMIQPIGGSIYLLLCLMEQYSFRIKGKEILKWGLIISSVIVLGFVGDVLGYHDEEWRKYEKFNEARTAIFDFYGSPDYYEVEHILKKYNVSEKEYNAFCDYIILNWEVPSECVDELAEFARLQNEIEFHELGERIIKNFQNIRFMGILKAGICLWVCSMGWVLFQCRWRLFPPLLVLIVTYTGIVVYLLYQGRTPERVMYPLTIGLSLFVIILQWRDFTENGTKVWMLGYILLCGLIWGKLCTDAGMIQYRTVKENNSRQQIYIEGLVEIREYCNKNLDNCYLLDSWSFCYYRGSAFDSRLYSQANCTLTGSWYSNSPVLRRHLKDYINQEQHTLCLIIYGSDESENSTAVHFLQEKTGKVAELAERLTVSHGGEYHVYRFD